MNEFFIFCKSDYLYCETHGICLAEDAEEHIKEFNKDKECMIIAMDFVIKSNRKNRKDWLPKNVVEKLGMKYAYLPPIVRVIKSLPPKSIILGRLKDDS